MNLIHKLKRPNKPWAILGVSRREYEARRPWKKAGMSREVFEEIVVELPAEMVTDIKEHAQAEMLLEGLFGAAASKEG